MQINSGNLNNRIIRSKTTYNSSETPASETRKRWNIRWIKADMDKPFLVIVITLLVFGVVMMFSASYAWGLYDYGDGYYYAKKQILAAVIGIVVMYFVTHFDYHMYQNTKLAYLFFIFTWVLNLFTAFKGREVAGAKRWITIGIEFQPSELLKVAIIIIFAYIISMNYSKFNKKWTYGIVPFAIIIALCALTLVLQRHMSGVLIVGMIGLSLMFVGGVPRKNFWAFVGVCAGAGVMLLLFRAITNGDLGYISERIQSWRDPSSDIKGSTYQTWQSLLAIGSGGVFGLGFGESKQKFLYLSESQNDFVFSIICEELGLIGAIIVMLLFALFVFRGFYIAANSPDKFGMILSAGITIQIGLQALLNIAVATNSFPNTGISLPFFSYGGTALMIQLIEMGMVLSVSRQSKTME